MLVDPWVSHGCGDDGEGLRCDSFFGQWVGRTSPVLVACVRAVVDGREPHPKYRSTMTSSPCGALALVGYCPPTLRGTVASWVEVNKVSMADAHNEQGPKQGANIHRPAHPRKGQLSPDQPHHEASCIQAAGFSFDCSFGFGVWACAIWSSAALLRDSRLRRSSPHLGRTVVIGLCPPYALYGPTAVPVADLPSGASRASSLLARLALLLAVVVHAHLQRAAYARVLPM